MPILTNRPSDDRVEPSKEVNTPQVISPEETSVFVDTRYESRSSLLTFIEGASWVVKYYQQMLTEGSELQYQQLNKNAVYQQYTEISGLELKVSGTLSQSQDSETKNFDVTGEAIMYPFMIPNKGDMFIADIGDGREGIFAITNTERLTILREACFRVEYVLVAHSNQELIFDLEKKTIKRTHFVKRLLQHGENPIVVNEDYHRYLTLGEYKTQLINLYFTNFFDKSISSLAVPDQEFVTFDPFLVKTITSFMDTTEHSLLRTIKNYSIDVPNKERPLTVWDALLQMNDGILPMVNEKLALIDSRCFGAVPQFEGVYFSNVKDVVYPVDAAQDVYDISDFRPGIFESRDIRHQFKTTRLGSLGSLDKPAGTGIDALKPIHPVTFDEYYIFTSYFYNRDKENQSKLETLVRDALEGLPINQRVLVELCDASDKWGRLEKFYYIPILLLLIKMVYLGQ